MRSLSFVSGGVLPPASRGATLGAPWLLHAPDESPPLLSLACAPSLRGGPAPGCGAEALRSLRSMDGVDAWGVLAAPAAPAGPAAVHVRSRVLPVHVDANPLLPPSPSCGGPSAGAGAANYSALVQWPWKLIAGTPTNAAAGASGARLLDGWWTVRPYIRLPASGPGALSCPARAVGAPIGAPAAGGEGAVLLFNLDEDESERCDVSAEHPQEVAALLAHLAELVDPTRGFVRKRRNSPEPGGDPALANWTWGPWRP